MEAKNLLNFYQVEIIYTGYDKMEKLNASWSSYMLHSFPKSASQIHKSTNIEIWYETT